MGVLVIGVGNAFRSDDGAGLLVAGKLRAEFGSEIRVNEHCGEGSSILQMWNVSDDVIIIDAVQSQQPVGTILRLEATSQPLPAKYFRYSTHAVSVADAIEIARALGQLPRRLIFFGLVGGEFKPGTFMTEEMSRAVDKAVSHVRTEIALIRA